MSFKDVLDQKRSEDDKRKDNLHSLYKKIISQQNDLQTLGVKSISEGGGYDISTAGYQSGVCVSVELKKKSLFGKMYFFTIYCFDLGEFYLDLHYCLGYEGKRVWKCTVKDEEIEKAIVDGLLYYKSL